MAPSVRYRLRSNDVARYVIPPRAGGARSNRHGEEPTRAEKRIVDELDPRHRPLYQLTPSLDVVSYHHGGGSRVVVNLDELAAAQLASPDTHVIGATDSDAPPCGLRSFAVLARAIGATD